MTGGPLCLALASAALLLPGLAAPGQAGERPRLVGTVVAPGRAAAVFEEAAGGQVLRRVGDRVGSGLRLLAVRRGAVDLADAGGRPLTLRLGQAREAAPEAAPRPGRDAPAAGAGVAVGTAGGPVAGEGAGASALLPTDRPRMPPAARLVPVIREGRLAGVRLAGGPPDSLLVRAGVEPGDLLVAIDGRPLTGSGAEALAAIARALESARGGGGPLVIDIRRDSLALRLEVAGPAPSR